VKSVDARREKISRSGLSDGLRTTPFGSVAPATVHGELVAGRRDNARSHRSQPSDLATPDGSFMGRASERFCAQKGSMAVKIVSRNSDESIGIEPRIEPLALTVREACKAASIGRTRLYQLVARGELKIVKAGRRSLVPVDDLRRWFATLPASVPVRAAVAPGAG
jgi:excisionase family DNA binding protein